MAFLFYSLILRAYTFIVDISLDTRYPRILDSSVTTINYSPSSVSIVSTSNHIIHTVKQRVTQYHSTSSQKQQASKTAYSSPWTPSASSAKLAASLLRLSERPLQLLKVLGEAAGHDDGDTGLVSRVGGMWLMRKVVELLESQIVVVFEV